MRKLKKKVCIYERTSWVIICVSAFFDQDVEKMIKVSRAQRSKKKHVTIIVGLKTFGTNQCSL